MSDLEVRTEFRIRGDGFPEQSIEPPLPRVGETIHPVDGAREQVVMSVDYHYERGFAFPPTKVVVWCQEGLSTLYDLLLP